MTKIVLKKLLLQIIVVVSLVFLLTYIPNNLFGPKNIKYSEVGERGDKGFIFLTSNNELPDILVTDNNGNILLEKPNQLPKVLTLGKKSLLLFKGQPTISTYITDVYTLEEASEKNGNKIDIKEQKGLLKDIFLNIESQNIFETNYSTSPSSKETNIPLCVLKERKPNILNCFSINTNDFSYTKINTEDINQKMSKYLSNRYELISETYDQVVEDTFVSFRLMYIDDDKNYETPSNPVFLFKITNNGVVITQDNSARHTIDQTEIQTDILMQDTFDYTQGENTDPLNSVYVYENYREPIYPYTLGNTPAFSSVIVNNPIIGEQFIEYRGKKILSWFSTYNHNYISAGLIYDYIYMKINQDIYLINTEVNKTYKLNNKQYLDTYTRIHPIFAF